MIFNEKRRKVVVSVERTVHIDNSVYKNVGAQMIPQQYIQIDNNVFYLQDRQHYNGLKVWCDKQSRKFYCVIGKERVFIKGYKY